MDEQNNQFLTVDLIDNDNGTTAQVKLEQVGTDIQVTVDGVSPISDIRGVFFNISDDTLLNGLTVTGENVTDSAFIAGSVNDLGQGANVNPDLFDGGVEIGTPGIGADDFQSTTFTLSNPTADLTLDEFLGQEFGLRFTSVGENRQDSSKLIGTAPATVETIAATATEETVAMMETETIQEMQMVEESGIFDEAVYLAENADVAAAVAAGLFASGIEHFVRFGKFESFRKFSQIFSVEAYLAQNADVARAVAEGGSAIEHYLSFGQFEPREFSYIFRRSYYLEQHADVAAVVNAGGTTPLQHFRQFGIAENRPCNPLIDPDEYRSLNPDVAAAEQRGETTAIEHFLRFGRFERREFSRVFSISEYREFNPDVAAAIDAGVTTAFDHLTTFGVREFRKLSKFVDLGFFVGANASFLQEVFNVTEVTEIDGSELVSYLEENAVSLGLATSESFNFSSLLASFSAEQLLGFFGTASTVEISFSEIAEFLSSSTIGEGILALAESFSAVQLEQLFSTATFAEVSEETINAFQESSEGQAIAAISSSLSAAQFEELFAVSSFAEVSIEALTEFASSSLAQSILSIQGSLSAVQLEAFLGSSSFGEISIEAFEEFVDSTLGQSFLSGSTSFSSEQIAQFLGVESFAEISVEALTALVSSSEGQQTVAETPAINIPVTNPIEPEEPPQPPETTGSFDFEYIIRTNREELLEVEQFAQIDFENLETLTANQIAAILAYAEEQNLSPSPFVDATFLQSTVSVQLANLGVSVEGLSQQQLIEVALEQGISVCPTIDFGFFTERYESILLTRFGVESVAEIGFAELFEFISTEALDLGLSSSAFLDIEFYRTTYQVQLEQRFGVSIEEITNQDIFEYANNEGLNEGLSPSVFVRVNYYKALYETEIIQFFGVGSLEEVSNVEIIGYITTTGLEDGLNPSFSVGFNYFKAVYAEEIEAAGLVGASNDELLDFISAIAVEQGLNSSAFVNVGYLKRQYREEIRAFYDIEGVEELSEVEILQYAIGSEDVPFVDTKYYRWKYAEELEEFYEDLTAEEITDDQVKSFALGAGAEQGLSLSAFEIRGYSIEYASQLQEFYKVDDIDELTDRQIREFIVGAGRVEFNIEFVEFVDIEYYRVWDEPALIDLFGPDFTDADVIDFVFGDAAPFIDEDYYKWSYGEEETEDGTLVKDLEGEEFKMYVFNEGWLAGFTSNLSGFDLEAFADDHATALQNFYEVEATELTEAQVYRFIVREAWKEGISIADFVSDENLEFYLEKNEEALASFFDIDIEAVADLSADIVLDFQFGGFSQGIDYGYVRFEYEEELLAFYTEVTSVADLSELQILEYFYSELFVAEDFSAFGFTLSAIDIYGYARTYAQKLAEYFHVDIEEVAGLDIEEIRKFAFGKGIELGISLEGFVNLEYIRENYEAAIVSFFVDVEGELTDAQVLEWFGSEFQNIDVEFVRYQIEQLTVEQRTELLASLEIDIDIENIALLTVQQLIDISYSVEFAAILEVEEVKKFAIDIEGYREAFAEKLIEFYKPDKDTGKDTGNDTGKDTGNDTGNDTGKDTGNDTGKDTGKDTGNDTGKDTGKDTGNDTGKDTGNDTGKDTGNDTGKDTGNDTGKDTGNDTGKDTGNDTGDTGADADIDDDVDGDDFDIDDITDKQVIKYMFGPGLKMGINPLDFVEVGYLREAFEYELVAHYEVESLAEISDELVVEFLYGDVSAQVDYEFYSFAYEEQLIAEFGLSSIEEITEAQILKHVITVGLPEGLDLTPVDVEGYIEEYKEEIAAVFDVEVKEVLETKVEDIITFAFGTGLELGLDATKFAAVDYYSANFSAEIVSNYRLEQVYNFSYEQAFQFGLSAGVEQGFNTSAVIDLEWYSEEYANEIEIDFEAIDVDGNGDVDNSELYDYITGLGLEKGQNPSELIDFESYLANYGDEVLAYALELGQEVETIDDVSYATILDFMLSVGIEEGFAPSADATDLEAFRADEDNAQVLAEFYGVASVEEVTLIETFNYVYGAGSKLEEQDQMMADGDPMTGDDPMMGGQDPVIG